LRKPDACVASPDVKRITGITGSQHLTTAHQLLI
jgi:hypothetical protein